MLLDTNLRPIRAFPDPSRATVDGVVAVGGDLGPETLLQAYRAGIFPWPHEGYPMLWFSPPRRAVLDFASLHVPRSLARARRHGGLTFTIDKAFDQVIGNCRSATRPGQAGTWIVPELEAAYLRLHHLGVAHSAEAWSADDVLVGGLYGVDCGGCFSGESMFHISPNASKLTLLFLVRHLAERGLDFIDIQQLTPHMVAMGAREIPRAEFLKRWKLGLQSGHTLFGTPPGPKSSPV